MKKIVKVEKRTVQYQCEVCKALYKTPAEAKKCEARPVEDTRFVLGQNVRSVEQRQCHVGGHYYAKGTVQIIFGPELSDDDYEIRHLGGKKERLNLHVFRYVIEYICPRCGRAKDAVYYAPELKAG